MKFNFLLKNLLILLAVTSFSYGIRTNIAKHKYQKRNNIFKAFTIYSYSATAIQLSIGTILIIKGNSTPYHPEPHVRALNNHGLAIYSLSGAFLVTYGGVSLIRSTIFHSIYKKRKRLSPISIKFNNNHFQLSYKY